MHRFCLWCISSLCCLPLFQTQPRRPSCLCSPFLLLLPGPPRFSLHAPVFHLQQSAPAQKASSPHSSCARLSLSAVLLLPSVPVLHACLMFTLLLFFGLSCMNCFSAWTTFYFHNKSNDHTFLHVASPLSFFCPTASSFC